MPDTYFHGIKINELTTGARNIAGASSNVIGLVATADDADVTVFPLNVPVLVTDINAALGKAGVTGTLAKALNQIANQTSPIMIVVRVASAVSVDAQNANVIGSNTGGVYTGMQALLIAQGITGVKPKILGGPGLDDAVTTAAMVIVAKKLRGFTYARPAAETVPDAITARALFSARELELIWPEWSTGWVGDAVAMAMGKRAQIDQEVGWHQALSNNAVDGVTGISKHIGFDILDSNNDAGLLNQNDITTLVNMNGFRFWGSRTCSDDARFTFETATRTSQFLHDTMGYGLAPWVDKPINKNLVRDILDSMNAVFRRLKSQGRIIGGSASFDASANAALSLAGGAIGFNMDYTPCAPAEQIGLGSLITEKYYVNLGAGTL